MKNKILKRLFSILLCVSMFCFMPVLGFASGLQTEKPTLSSLPKNQQVSYSLYSDLFESYVNAVSEATQYLQKVTYMNRLYYFSVMLDNGYGCSSSVSSGNYFNDEYLWFYFKYLLSHVNWQDDSSIGFLTICNEDGIPVKATELYFNTENMGFFPSNWSGRNIAWNLSDPPKYFLDFKNFFNYLYSCYISEQKASSDAISDYDNFVNSDEFKEAIEYMNTLTTPKGKDLFIQSFRSDSRWRAFERVNNHGSIMQNPYIPLFDDTQKTQLKDLWFVPFYQDENSVRYYSDYQFHLYYVPNDDPNSDIALQLDLYRVDPEFGCILQSPYSGIVAEFTSATVPLSIVFNTYLNYRTNKARGISEIYSLTLDDYLNGEITFTHNFTGHFSEEYLPKEIFHYKSSDGSKTLDIYKGADGFPDSKFEYCLEKSTAAPNEDIGFICSHSLIVRTYTDIDTSKIPPNQVINITGDTIYDYSITNPETGQTSTINNYITNNYNYPALPTTSGGGSGGVGGDVNVTGSIGVHGDVGVDVTVSVPDININVNQGNGAGGNGGNINDYVDTSGDVDVGGVISKLPQLSKGFTDYLRGFFVWLPPEIYALIILIIVIYVWKALISRR